jgi:hypothetical protein
MCCLCWSHRNCHVPLANMGLHCAQVPGNIRRAEHFCSFLRQLVSYMRERISVQAVEQESCTAFLAALQEQMSVDGAHMSDCSPKAPSWLSCMQVTSWLCVAWLCFPSLLGKYTAVQRACA